MESTFTIWLGLIRLFFPSFFCIFFFPRSFRIRVFPTPGHHNLRVRLHARPVLHRQTPLNQPANHPPFVTPRIQPYDHPSERIALSHLITLVNILFIGIHRSAEASINIFFLIRSQKASRRSFEKQRPRTQTRARTAREEGAPPPATLKNGHSAEWREATPDDQSEGADPRRRGSWC